ncbi:DUF262 domain-containing protein [Isoptericola sp. b515]|uniref:DUF262 domain-containing protein n=1 Tax=Isoptericola sp. b515 TaxID=3064652 RepID=UPI0027126D29|nr:DUF262 domain-containing protein [Isoptericola sp. b515]MDO8147503.1 DUF262 domain-containing protein [Isoptericola sp. b515]
MKAETTTPRELFEGRVHYIIPPYQRPYVWNAEDQWEPLWEDVARLAEAELSFDGTGRAPNHFLGAVVYESQPTIAGDVSRHLVIDGQQRTTTLQILLDAVHQVLVERGHEDIAEDLEDLILNKGSKYKGKAERFKLWPSRNDRDAFAHAMDPQSEDELEHRIVSAHAFFRQETATWLAGTEDVDGVAPPGSEEARAGALSSTLQLRLLLVTINLTDSEESQLIFETLNDRGTPLLRADLVKNWIFQTGHRVGAEVEEWPETFWADFDDDWWRQEISQGRALRSRIDIFLQYWLTMRTRDEVRTENVFRVFTQHAAPLMQSATEAEHFLGALRKDADTYRSFAQLDVSTPEGSFYGRVIETMELAATTPLLLWMISANHRVPEQQVRIGLGALESWVIRRTLLSVTMRDVNRMMVAILKILDQTPVDEAGQAVRDFLTQQTANSRYWPTDVEMVEQLPKVRLYGNVRQNRLKEVLSAVEQHLRTKQHEDVSLPTKLQIEHVMPRAWRHHWDEDPKLTPEDAAARDRHVDTIGNLTLISQPLNGTLSNRPWTDAESSDLSAGGHAGLGKRSLLAKYSLLVLSKELVDEHGTAWTDDDISARSASIAERICAVWPRETP